MHPDKAEYSRRICEYLDYLAVLLHAFQKTPETVHILAISSFEMLVLYRFDASLQSWQCCICNLVKFFLGEVGFEFVKGSLEPRWRVYNGRRSHICVGSLSKQL